MFEMKNEKDTTSIVDNNQGGLGLKKKIKQMFVFIMMMSTITGISFIPATAFATNQGMLDNTQYQVIEQTFSDVANYWATSAIKWGVDTGMVYGYTDGTFKPDQQLTEAEFAAL